MLTRTLPPDGVPATDESLNALPLQKSVLDTPDEPLLPESNTDTPLGADEPTFNESLEALLEAGSNDDTPLHPTALKELIFKILKDLLVAAGRMLGILAYFASLQVLIAEGGVATEYAVYLSAMSLFGSIFRALLQAVALVTRSAQNETGDKKQDVFRAILLASLLPFGLNVIAVNLLPLAFSAMGASQAVIDAIASQRAMYVGICATLMLFSSISGHGIGSDIQVPYALFFVLGAGIIFGGTHLFKTLGDGLDSLLDANVLQMGAVIAFALAYEAIVRRKDGLVPGLFHFKKYWAARHKAGEILRHGFQPMIITAGRLICLGSIVYIVPKSEKSAVSAYQATAGIASFFDSLRMSVLEILAADHIGSAIKTFQNSPDALKTELKHILSIYGITTLSPPLILMAVAGAVPSFLNLFIQDTDANQALRTAAADNGKSMATCASAIFSTLLALCRATIWAVKRSELKEHKKLNVISTVAGTFSSAVVPFAVWGFQSTSLDKVGGIWLALIMQQVLDLSIQLTLAIILVHGEIARSRRRVAGIAEPATSSGWFSFYHKKKDERAVPLMLIGGAVEADTLETIDHPAPALMPPDEVAESRRRRFV